MNQKSSLREDPQFVSWVLTGNTSSESPKAISHSFISASSRISSDLGSNVVNKLLRLFEHDVGAVGLLLCSLYQGRGDGLTEFGEIVSLGIGLDARRDHRAMLSPIRSRWPARRACQFVHRLLKFLNKVLRAG